MNEERKPINWKPYIITSIISLIIGIFFFCLFFLILKRPLLDGTAYASIILISVGVLMWVGTEGFFDIFAYGFRQLGSMIFSKNPREFHDYPGYKDYKNEIRVKQAKIYLAVIVVGVLFLFATVIIYAVTKP